MNQQDVEIFAVSVNMSSVEYLRGFVSERLTAAAEEIFGAFKKIIIDYEEEIDRQRRQLGIVRKLETGSNRIELPQQYVHEEKEDLTQQQLSNQERTPSMDQEDPKPPPMKEEEEELCISQEEEQLVVKQETDALLLTPKIDYSEVQTAHTNPDETLAAQNKSAAHMLVISSVAGEANDDLQLLPNSSYVAESQDQEGETDERQKNCLFKTNTGERPYVCQICRRDFKHRGHMKVHMRVHTGEKPYVCSTCGKDFKTKGELSLHTRIHTGEKPYVCNTCGRDFCQSGQLTVHTRSHTGEKPFVCKTCGKDFRHAGQLTDHTRRAHTGEKPHMCKVCLKSYCSAFELTRHRRSHTDE